jgi:hypothetical protein
MAASTGPNKRTMVILCSILGILAVVAVFRLMGGGGGDDAGTSAPPATSVTSTPGGATATTPTTVAPGEPTVPSGEFDVFATRDPFEPVVQVGGSSSAATTADTTPATTAAGGGTATTPTTNAAQNPAAGTSVVLVDVFTGADGTLQATVQVGSTAYTVAAGQTFAVSYKVVSLSGTCGQFLYGDSPFSLCKGEQVIK